MKNPKHRNSVLLGVIIFSVFGCGDPFDFIQDLARHPVLEVESLPAGRVYVLYSGVLVASMKNDPNDDSYAYRFSIVSGSLPPGIAMARSGRWVLLDGTPTVSGRFTFEIQTTVYFSPPDSGDSESTNTDFTIVITR